MKPRTKFPADVVSVAAPVFACAETLEYDEKSVSKGLAKEGMGAILDAAREALLAVPADAWTPEAIDGALDPLPEALDAKKRIVFQAVRVAECGNMVSPPGRDHGPHRPRRLPGVPSTAPRDSPVALNSQMIRWGLSLRIILKVTMVFDFGSEEFLWASPTSKGGEGHFDAKMHDDGRCKVIRGRIEPGSTSGYHLHEANCEVIYEISGRAWFDYDGEREYAEAGQAHYCPMGHSHAMGNASQTEPLEVFCVVA